MRATKTTELYIEAKKHFLSIRRRPKQQSGGMKEQRKKRRRKRVFVVAVYSYSIKASGERGTDKLSALRQNAISSQSFLSLCSKSNDSGEHDYIYSLIFNTNTQHLSSNKNC
jgi:hypothetical protein